MLKYTEAAGGKRKLRDRRLIIGNLNIAKRKKKSELNIASTNILERK